ncbi:MAG: DNA translocase FtsK, partial [Desulfovibrio sp.]
RARRGEKQAARDEEEFPPLFRNLGTPGETPVSQAEPVRELPSESVPPKTEPPSKPKPTSKSAPQKKQSRPAPQRKGAGETVLPHLELIEDLEQEELRIDKAALVARAQDLQAAMENFNVKGQVRDIHPGPVVTMFEFKPASGVRINKIAGLADDLALALKALAVRIVAPIPGKDTVGIEIPNEQRQMVGFREILDAPSFADAKSVLTMALGKDISGRPRSADLSRMPHLLVAGATGAGKSVCLNAILLSFLFKAGPEQVRLLLVDPKRIELSVYADLPHLVHPVVTDMAEAKTALEWAVYEMDRRYEAMAKLGVRNIEGYNAKLAKLGPEALQEKEEWAELANLPYLVIVIDELADLMFTAAKEAEMSIVRLAQLARAAGIHMILATQRPSVDVVTGLIKANFPCRISFQVTSKFDSRTILDSVGAEYLLGKGDMLFKPSGGKLERMHGAYVRDEDVNQVVDFWRSQQGPDYELDFASWQREGGNGDGGEPGEPGGMDNDPMYTQAVDFVLSQGKGSISLLQRRFRIGFNRAARYIEQMEADGYVGPADGSKPRLVLKGRE